MKNSEDKKTSIPELRFPEFADTNGWVYDNMKELYSFKPTNSFSRNDLNDNYGNVKNIHYGDIHVKFNTLLNVKAVHIPFINDDKLVTSISSDNFCIDSDIIFADASEDLEGVGKSIEIINVGDDKIVSGMHTIHARQKKNIFKIGFGGYLFKSNYIRKQIQRESQGAKVLGISHTRMASMHIYYPDSKIEQQKIIDCLSSIDELIDAEVSSLDLYKDHKKGLLQKLFPQNGKTTPESRFPEFENSDEWVEKTLGKIALYENGKAHEQDISKSGAYIAVNSKFISTDGKTKKLTNTPYCIAQKNDVLMVLSDLPNGRALAKCFFVDIDDYYTVNQRICRLTPTKVLGIMLFYSLNRNKHLLSFDDGVKQTNLKKDDVLSCPILLPNNDINFKEQQKIADCLSSIDELIEQQINKVETLKAHKKGLIQQLFPKI